MEKVAVFPVPDCAWAMTSEPGKRGQRHEWIGLYDPRTLDDRHDSALLDSRGALEAIGIYTWNSVSVQRVSFHK